MGSVKGVLLELEELKLENTRLREAIDEANKAECDGWIAHTTGKIPVNPDDMVRIIDKYGRTTSECGRKAGIFDWEDDFVVSYKPLSIPSDRVADKPKVDTDGFITGGNYEAGLWSRRNIEAFIADGNSIKADRITEQDVLALVGSAMHHYIFNDRNVTINDWFESEGRALLNKLNADRETTTSSEITMPRTEDEAVGMWLIGEAWVKQNAPHRLKEGRQSEDKIGMVPDEVRNILERISRWHGEFPPTGKFWDDDKTRPISYGAEYGSNGERDYMRGLADQALAMLSASPVDSEGE